jgi:hypothetical protein
LPPDFPLISVAITGRAELTTFAKQDLRIGILQGYRMKKSFAVASFTVS